jgi:hypothetical protein
MESLNGLKLDTNMAHFGLVLTLTFRANDTNSFVRAAGG